MKPTYTKASATEITISKQVDEVVSLDALNQRITDAIQSIAVFEQWVIDERAGRQAIIDEIQSHIDEAGKLGVVTSAVVAITL